VCLGWQFPAFRQTVASSSVGSDSPRRMDCLAVNMKALLSFRMLGTVWPTRESHFLFQMKPLDAHYLLVYLF